MEVSRDVYASVLDEDMPDSIGDTLTVDRRGYAPAIADHLEPDYMEQHAFIFSPEQTEEDLLYGGDVLDELLDDVFSGMYVVDGERYPTAPVIDIATDYGPITLDITAELTRDGYRFTAVPDDGPGLNGLDTALEQYRTLEELDRTTLRDRATVETLTEWADRYRDRYDRFAGLEPPQTLGRTTASGITFDHDGRSGRVSRSAVTIDDTLFRLRDLSLPEGTIPALQTSWEDVNGILEQPALVTAEHTPINVIVNPDTAAPDTVQTRLSDYLDRMDTNRRQNSHNASSRMESIYDAVRQVQAYRDGIDTPLFGMVSSTYERVNVLTTGTVEVHPVTPANQSCSVHGSPPDSPEYTLIARTDTLDITVYHLPPEELLHGETESLLDRLEQYHDLDGY